MVNIPHELQEIPYEESMNKMKKYLKQHAPKSSFRTRESVQEYVHEITSCYRIPWRKDQKEILDFFFHHQEWKEIVVQAIFGGGKTTMILAILYHLVLHKQCHPSQIFMCAFNCAIKNELIKKTKKIGKCRIQTFDSFIYHQCKQLEYPHLKLLNFESKRKYVYEHLSSIVPNTDIRYVFIDESQDLEKSCYFILKQSFTMARFMFVGDIFQSIQKEPRDSLLWYLLNHSLQGVHLFQMYDTPRVPRTILAELKETLYDYYPEFQSTISQWNSSSKVNRQYRIRWKPFRTYHNVYQQIEQRLQRWKASETMILTFSSAITVRGSLGDVSRFRRFFHSRQIPLNLNHKKMMDDRLFLTTANSSKGLERRNVIVVITFPLELAFMNFSDDLVMNLITVAISRTKRNLLFYVPEHADRFSRVLSHFSKCPSPSLSPPSSSSLNTDLTSSTSPENQKKRKKTTRQDPSDISDPLQMLLREHCITELLRQNILSFETQEYLLSFAKLFHKETIHFDHSNFSSIQTEEECCLLGLIFESLLLSYWTHRFPVFRLDDENIHPFFHEHNHPIRQLYHQYIQYCHRYESVMSQQDSIRFQGCYLYARLHLYVYHKIQIQFPQSLQSMIQKVWNELKPSMERYRLDLKSYQFKTQHPVSMPFVTGIMDACGQPTQSSLPLVIYEIKASRARDWKKLAILQSILYGILSAKNSFTIHVINVLASPCLSFHISFQKNLILVRNRIIQDILTWNLNCFLSKNVKQLSNRFMDLSFDSCLFMDQDEQNLCLCYVLSPTKVRFELLDYRNEPESVQERLRVYQTCYHVRQYYRISQPALSCEGCGDTQLLWKNKEQSISEMMGSSSHHHLQLDQCHHRLSFAMTCFITHPHHITESISKTERS